MDTVKVAEQYHQWEKTEATRIIHEAKKGINQPPWMTPESTKKHIAFWENKLAEISKISPLDLWSKLTEDQKTNWFCSM
jgi:hypothetical protein